MFSPWQELGDRDRIGSDFKAKYRLSFMPLLFPCVLECVGACALYVLVAIIWLIPDRRIEKTLVHQESSETDVVIQILALLLMPAPITLRQNSRAGPLPGLLSRDDVLGRRRVKFDPVKTPKGTFHVWTKRVGNNPTMKVLLLHRRSGCHA